MTLGKKMIKQVHESLVLASHILIYALQASSSDVNCPMARGSDP